MNGNKKIKVLECIRQGQIGGGETHVLELVRRIDKKLFEPVVLSFTNGPMIEEMEKMGIKTYIIPTLKAFDRKVRKKVKEVLINEKPDIVHAHGTRALSNTISVSKKMGISVLYTVHGWSFHDGLNSLFYKIRVLSEKYLCSKTNKNICVSYAGQDEGKSRFKLNNSVVIPNGIDTEKFDPEKTYQNIRTELDIPPSAMLVGFIARMTEQKNPIFLLEAFLKAALINPDLHLLLVGDGDLKDECIDFVEENSLEKRVTFSPFRQDIPAVLDAIDIFCLPSLWEGLSIGVLEAMAMNKAVLVSDIEANSELINDEVNGLTFSLDDINSLSEHFLSLASDRAFLNQLGAAAGQTVLEKYSLSSMVNKIENLYLSLQHNLPLFVDTMQIDEDFEY